MPRYTEQQFLDVSKKVLPKTSSNISRYIGAQVWKYGGYIRDVISIGKLVRKSDGHEEIQRIMDIMCKYGNEKEVRKSMLMAIGITWVLIKSKQVGVVLEVAAIRHRMTIITGMGIDMIAAFNQARQTLVAK